MYVLVHYGYVFAVPTPVTQLNIHSLSSTTMNLSWLIPNVTNPAGVRAYVAKILALDYRQCLQQLCILDHYDTQHCDNYQVDTHYVYASKYCIAYKYNKITRASYGK
eukprot:GHVR01060866.1.p1 GENE.GHVR01060866.1~~GHVR01060866.1.p1  ORF type:complete len:107 (+),score=2.46 GHVR01060866.1:69-389(+)